jgi:hypothetical protein
VIQEGEARYEDVPKLDVTVKEMWMWNTRISDSKRSEFHFAMKTEFSSDVPELENMPVVEVRDFRNGGRQTNWKSYRNTIMHSMKGYIVNFNGALAESSAIAAQGDSEGSSVGRVIDVIEELVELEESGAISEGEFDALKEMAIEEQEAIMDEEVE